ncbi:hypothetical protein AKO1_005228 [Acrasis kona]|uniref:Uncharacterized protein n=1 Tax=Acrasis kona TaxID=1008807 RepID=A0AAW2YLH9_9EUKA
MTNQQILSSALGGSALNRLKLQTTKPLGSLKCDNTIECRDRTYAIIPLDENTFLTSHHSNSLLHTWDVTNGGKKSSIGRRKDDFISVYDACLLPSGRIACASIEKGVKIFDLNDEVVVNEIKDLETPTISGHHTLRCFHYNGCDYILVISNDNSLKVVNVTTSGGQTEKTVQDQERIYCVEVLSDGCVVTGSDSNIKLWDIENNKCIILFEDAHYEGVLSLCLVSHNLLASGGGPEDCSVKVWDLKTKELVFTLQGHEGAVRHISLVGENTIASASDDKTVRFWDLLTGCEMFCIKEHRGPVKCVERVGDKIITGSNDETIKIWSF